MDVVDALQQWVDRNAEADPEQALGLPASVVAATIAGDVLPTQALIDLLNEHRTDPLEPPPNFGGRFEVGS